MHQSLHASTSSFSFNFRTKDSSFLPPSCFQEPSSNMSFNDQNQPQLAIAYPTKESAAPACPYFPVPPPAVTHDQAYPEKVTPKTGETNTKGHGFWRGCCAGLCCYCCLDMCF